MPDSHPPPPVPAPDAHAQVSGRTVPEPAPPVLPAVPVGTPVVAKPAGRKPRPERGRAGDARAARDLAPPARDLAPPARPVLAFFYAWYAPPSWAQPPMSDLPPDRYLSDDRSVMSRQISQAHSAGIDGFVSSWAGSGSDTDRNFAQLLDLCPDGFYACPYFETALIKEAGLDLTQELIGLQRYMNHPHFFRYQGRPVIFFWAPKAIGAPAGQTSVQAWRLVRQTADPRGTQCWNVETKDPEPWFEVFDGFHLFSAADWAAPTADDLAPLLRTNVMFRQRTDGYNRRHKAGRLFVAGVRPGYNDVDIRNQQRINDPSVPLGYVRERAGGRYYQMSSTAAAGSHPDWLVITSFNEWYEGSQIEPSVTYGDLYLSLTLQVVAGYRAAGGPLPTPAWPPDVQYFPATGHVLQRGFRDYWNQPGNIKKLGAPVTDEIGQTINGANYVVQYFLNGFRLQWNTNGTEPTELVPLGPNDWHREPQ